MKTKQNLCFIFYELYNAEYTVGSAHSYTDLVTLRSQNHVPKIRKY